MPSQLKSDTARANGAKSHGPKSAETREKSSRNSLRHGFTSRHTLLLECENPDEFKEMQDEYAAMHHPATPAEHDLVDEMIAARWRIRRIRSIETIILDSEMMRHAEQVEKQFVQPDSAVHMAMAFQSLVEESRSMALISRYESRLQRAHDRAYRTLREVQQAGRLAAPQKNGETNPETTPIPPGVVEIRPTPFRAAAVRERSQPAETNPQASVEAGESTQPQQKMIPMPVSSITDI